MNHCFYQDMCKQTVFLLCFGLKNPSLNRSINIPLTRSLAKTRIIVVAVKSANSPDIITVSYMANIIGYSEFAARE